MLHCPHIRLPTVPRKLTNLKLPIFWGLQSEQLDQNLKVLKRDNEIKGKGTAFEFPRVPLHDCITPEQVAAPGAVRSD